MKDGGVGHQDFIVLVAADIASPAYKARLLVCTSLRMIDDSSDVAPTYQIFEY